MVSGARGAEEVVDRRRVTIIDPGIKGAVQPYHFAKELELSLAEQHVARCASASGSLALAAVRELVEHLKRHGYQLVNSCVLLSSGRQLPEFARILASHALIHTAEGEFFREAFRAAITQSGIPVTGIRERDLAGQAELKWGKEAGKLQQRVAAMGRSLGPPWTTDQKNAALGALLVLTV